MLGISVPDAIALGTLILAALAGWRGATQGAIASKTQPPPGPAFTMAGAAFADTTAMTMLAAAINGLSEAVRDRTHEQERQGERDTRHLLEAMLEELRRPGHRQRQPGAAKRR